MKTERDKMLQGSCTTRSRDVPDDVFAAGNPCRMIRALEPGSRPDMLNP